MFAIIGVQSFNNSLRRNCVWQDPTNSTNNYTNTDQFCGSYMYRSDVWGYIEADGSFWGTPKGYTCPMNSLCKTVENPYGGTIGFDNIFQSLELVFVIMSFNTFTDIMYKVVDAENLGASLFFIVGSLSLGLWLANLFIAVIVTSFKKTREENLRENNKGTFSQYISFLFQNKEGHVKHVCRKKIGQHYYYLREIPLFFIAVDMLVQCAGHPRTFNSVLAYQIFLSVFLAFEILLRLYIYLPDYRFFFSSILNILDLFLAVATLVILIPTIRGHPVLYSWLTVFQIVRFYRIVISIPYMRGLWVRVLSNFKPILNITLFYFLITYLTALLACQLLRGVVPQSSDGSTIFFHFQHLANSFVALYVISTTENWTGILYSSVQNASSRFAQVCIAAFFIGWFILSNYVVLNMFVAVITENLEIPLSGKKREQIKQFVIGLVNERNTYRSLTETRDLALERLNIRRRAIRPHPERDVLEMIMKDNTMDTFLDNDVEAREERQANEAIEKKNSRSLLKTILNMPSLPINYLIARNQKRQLENPFHDTHEIREFSNDRQQNSETIINGLLQAKRDLEEKRKKYLEENPNYNKSLILFKPNNRVRKFCQKLVAPSYGTRLEGHNPKPIVWYLFSTFMALMTLVLVIIACVATPLYYLNLVNNQDGLFNWVILTDIVFVFIFTVESAIKIIADGFYFTPNAYMKSIWGVIDFTVLVTMWINMVEEIYQEKTVARLIRAFKALRALRLLTFIPEAQELFHNVIIVGVWRLFSVAVVSFGLLFPFSIWGKNIFAGRLVSCNNSNFTGDMTRCFGEWSNSPFNWNIWSPQSVGNSYFDFDDFGHSLRLLFEIISLEGWVDVLEAVMNISPNYWQPEYYAGAFNGSFVILYNLVGTVFILTLFISSIIQNYSVVRGSAYLTSDQKTWYEIEQMLKHVRPMVRPYSVKPGTFKHKVLQLCINPRSWLSIAMTADLVCLAIVLMSDFYPQSNEATISRLILLFILCFCYLMGVSARIYAFSWRKFVRRKWDLYALVVTAASSILNFLGMIFFGTGVTTFLDFQKIFLVAVLILLMPRSKRLNQLLKTVAASASAIRNLLIVWAILYLAYSIAFNQVFGLTRIGPNGSTSLNFRTVPRALVLLYKMSCGEGWNQIMSDFKIEAPYCYASDAYGYTDCGSTGYAYLLFISWNILSMYIFGNMFVSLIYENFSYVSRNPDNNVNRDELRKFKAAWFKFDPEGTGYIAKDDLYKLLANCEGYFSLKIHDRKWRVPEILANSQAATGEKYGVDLRALNKELRKYPATDAMHQRRLVEKFCHHAFMLADPQRGINFNALLVQFPFYKDLKYSECLKLRDYIRYRDVERRVATRVEQARTASAILMAQAVARRRYRLQAAREVQEQREWDEQDVSSPIAEGRQARSGSVMGAILPTIRVEDHHHFGRQPGTNPFEDNYQE